MFLIIYCADWCMDLCMDWWLEKLKLFYLDGAWRERQREDWSGWNMLPFFISAFQAQSGLLLKQCSRARIFTKDQLVFPLQVQQAPLNHKSISAAFWTFLLRISIWKSSLFLALSLFRYLFHLKHAISVLSARFHRDSFYLIFRFVWTVWIASCHAGHPLFSVRFSPAGNS